MFIIVLYIFFILCFGLYKKVDTYDAFKEGAENSFKSLGKLFPNILGIIVAVNVFLNSGITELINQFLVNLKIVPELLLQCLLKPLSWNSSILLMNQIYETYGPSSKVGIAASLIQNASDTALYVSVLYFSSIKMKHSGHTLLVVILTNFAIFITIILLFGLVS